MSNPVNFADDRSCPNDTYLEIRLSKLDQHDVWYLSSAAIKSLTIKLKVNNVSSCVF